MKYKLLVLLLIAALGIKAQSQDLIISKTDNSQLKYGIGNINKVMFNDSTLILKFNDGTLNNIPIINVRSIKLSAATGVSSTSSPAFSIYPNPAATTIIFQDLPPIYQMAEIFSLDGRLLLKKPVSDSDNIIDVSVIKQGIYMVKVNGKTIKLIKK